MIMIDMEAVITVEMIATGVLSPNEGFMDEVNYKSVLSKGRLENGLVWPVLLSFATTVDRNRDVVYALDVGDDVTLADVDKIAIALIYLIDIILYIRNTSYSNIIDSV